VSAIARLVHMRSQQYADDLDVMAEEAEADGTRGILVTWTATGYTMALDRRVPVGEIWEQR
jgi:hypothetical protein